MQRKSNLILTLDAGGTNLNFSAVKEGRLLPNSFSYPTNAHNLNSCLNSIKSGFKDLISSLEDEPYAISIAFPGPADYENGVIGDLPNLPAFKNGVPLASILENIFSIPVFINNDGDLFALGESKDGLLSEVNHLLKEIGSSKIYKNLIGITLGTGFGVGLSINGIMLNGDNSAAAEGWLLRNKHYSYSNIEDTVSIQAIKAMYAHQIAVDPSKAPEPSEIYEIAIGKKEGVREAAIETYLRYGDALGDAIASIITLFDGIVAIGGGISGAYPLFARSMFDELNGFFTRLNGSKQKRLTQRVFNFENEFERKQFLADTSLKIDIPNSNRKVLFHKEKKTILGLSRLGTDKAIALGAYYFAIGKLSDE
ncbi:MAG: ROK family protein [Balneolaceae bacterium]